MKRTKAQRPIDVKDTLWSHIGKDALDAAAERLWERIREETDADIHPYSWGSEQQITAQRAVLDVLGFAVPAMLRERAKDYPETGDCLLDLAEELEDEHG